MNIGFYAGHIHYLPHAKLLSQSIKKHVKNSRITVVINQEDYSFYQSDLTGVTFLCMDRINSYPFIDKIHAASLFEKTQNQAFIWMDVDSFINQPLYFSEKTGIQCNVVDMKNVGLAYHERPFELWEVLFNYFKIDINSLNGVYTTISNERIYPYYNLGLVCVHDHKSLFQKTAAEINTLINTPRIKSMIDHSALNKIFFHQMVFTCLVLTEFDPTDIHELPSQSNFPLHLNHKLDVPRKITDLISLRYDTYFETNHKFTEDLPSELYKMASHLSMLWYYKELI